MFPGPNATVYYNEAGEPLGWDDNYYDDEPDEPDWDRISDDEQAWEAGWEDGYYGEPSQVGEAKDSGDRAYEIGYGEGRSDRDTDDEANEGISDDERYGD